MNCFVEMFGHFVVLVVLMLGGVISCHDIVAAPVSWCQYRDIPVAYTADVFRLQASYGCYSYTAPSRINPEVGRYNTTSNVIGDLRYNCILVGDQKVNVDYLDQMAVEVISRSLKTPADTRKWLECCEAAVECCDYMLDNPDYIQGCPATWDGWSCWNQASNGSIQPGFCPDYIYSGSAPTCHHESSKECYDGAWNPSTDYTKCDITIRLKARITYHVTVLSISLAVSIPAIVIFFAYRKLRRTMRVTLHRNLLIAISARNIFTIISKTVVLLDALNASDAASSVISQNGVGCKVLAVLEKTAANAVFVTMLLLGVYLHRLIAAAFKGEPQMLWYFVIGAAVTCLPVIGWTVVMATLNDDFCWMVDDGGYQWINDTPRIIILIVNMLLILDIARVLVTKLSRVNTGNSSNIRRTAKATIFLMPVFGVQFVVTAVRPNTTDCLAEQVFYYFSYGLDGIQGAVVSLLFCYLNKEVQMLLTKTYYRLYDQVRTWLDPDFVSTGHPGRNNSRTTFSTLVEPNLKDISAPPTPILDARRQQPITAQPQQPIGHGHSNRNSNDLQKTRMNQVGSGMGNFLTPTYGMEMEFYTPKNSVSGSSNGLEFLTPRSSIAGSSTLYHSPRSSFSGSVFDDSFYDCIEEEQVFQEENAPKGHSTKNGGSRVRKSQVFDGNLGVNVGFSNSSENI